MNKPTEINQNSGNPSHLPILHFIWPVIIFAFSLLIPSTETLEKYFGLLGVVSYFIIASLLLLFGFGYFFRRLVSRITDKLLLWLTGFSFLILLVAFIIIYPIANSGVFGGGSDNDEALNLATTELLKGHYPYHIQTYLQMTPSILPGALILAIPFVLLGNGAYQCLFWFFAFLLTMNSYLKDRRQALLLLWVIIALSPVIMQQYVTGSDLLAESIYVLLSIMWMVNTVPQEGKKGWIKILLAVLLGLGLASRANFLLLVPLVCSALVQKAGWKTATKYMAVTCLTLGLMTIPFYLYDPQGFFPLHTNERLQQLQIILPALSGLLVFLLSFLRANSYLPGLLRNCAVVMAFPVLTMIIYQSIMLGNPTFGYGHYGLAFLFFGVVASAPMVFSISGTRTLSI
jgi:hypothetical protein